MRHRSSLPVESGLGQREGWLWSPRREQGALPDVQGGLSGGGLWEVGLKAGGLWQVEEVKGTPGESVAQADTQWQVRGAVL